MSPKEMKKQREEICSELFLLDKKIGRLDCTIESMLKSRAGLAEDKEILEKILRALDEALTTEIDPTDEANHT